MGIQWDTKEKIVNFSSEKLTTYRVVDTLCLDPKEWTGILCSTNGEFCKNVEAKNVGYT